MTSPKKLKDEKIQGEKSKLKVSANLVKIIAENKINKSENEVQMDWQNMQLLNEKLTFGK